VQLIVPDEQLYRIGHPHIVVPELRGRLFYFDEANVSWCPDTGSGLYEIYDHKTNVQVRSHWQSLLDMYPDDFLFVVRDNASQHVTPMLDDFLIDNQDTFCLVPLPTYSPHLNLIERLWHYMRDNITRSTFYITIQKLCEALVDWLRDIPFDRFHSLLGLSP
jgi:hypothetical protein